MFKISSDTGVWAVEILETIYEYFILLMFFGTPLISVVLACVSLFRYCYAKHKNKHCPDSFSDSQIKARLIWLIVTATASVIFVGAIVSIMVLLSMAIVYM